MAWARGIRGLVVAAALSATSARAAELSVNAGALEVVLVPGPAHGGLYPYLGGAVAFNTGAVTYLASLSLEWSFDQGRGGLVLVGTADVRLSELLGFDLNLALIHDQPGLDFGKALFFLGGGPGLSFFLERWTVSPYLSVFGGLTEPGASVVPGVNVAWTP